MLLFLLTLEGSVTQTVDSATTNSKNAIEHFEGLHIDSKQNPDSSFGSLE